MKHWGWEKVEPVIVKILQWQILKKALETSSPFCVNLYPEQFVKIIFTELTLHSFRTAVWWYGRRSAWVVCRRGRRRMLWGRWTSSPCWTMPTSSPTTTTSWTRARWWSKWSMPMVRKITSVLDIEKIFIVVLDNSGFDIFHCIILWDKNLCLSLIDIGFFFHMLTV